MTTRKFQRGHSPTRRTATCSLRNGFARNEGPSAPYARSRDPWESTVEGTVSGLGGVQFADLNETGLKSGSANGNGIVGVWQGTSQSTGATVGVRLGVFSPIFLNNGQVYYGEKFPTQGLDGLNTRIPPELYPRNWGTYTFSGGRGVMKMPYGDIPVRMGKAMTVDCRRRHCARHGQPQTMVIHVLLVYALRQSNKCHADARCRIAPDSRERKLYSREIQRSVCDDAVLWLPAKRPGRKRLSVLAPEAQRVRREFRAGGDGEGVHHLG